jgi:hypothetical protein
LALTAAVRATVAPGLMMSSCTIRNIFRSSKPTNSSQSTCARAKKAKSATERMFACDFATTSTDRFCHTSNGECTPRTISCLGRSVCLAESKRAVACLIWLLSTADGCSAYASTASRRQTCCSENDCHLLTVDLEYENYLLAPKTYRFVQEKISTTDRRKTRSHTGPLDPRFLVFISVGKEL